MKSPVNPPKRRRAFSPSFKVEVVARLAASNNISALARELGVARRLLYTWQGHFENGGIAELRRVGRPAGISQSHKASGDVNRKRDDHRIEQEANQPVQRRDAPKLPTGDRHVGHLESHSQY